jgi:endonuclease/exonuclease/phosphatase family metal-dependent hydrolase
VRLDHAFVTEGLTVRRTEIVRRPGLQRVSDHLPVIVDLELPPRATFPGPQRS